MFLPRVDDTLRGSSGRPVRQGFYGPFGAPSFAVLLLDFRAFFIFAVFGRLELSEVNEAIRSFGYWE